MRQRVVPALSAAAVLAALSCASILSIPDRTLKWCDRSGNAHAFCEDFDQADAGAGLDHPPVVVGAASLAFVPSDDTAPNALDTQTSALPGPDASAIAAMGKRFEDRKFDHVVVEADVRFIQANFVTQGSITTGVGFLLLEDQPSFCIGLVAAPSTSNLASAIDLGVVYVPNNRNCVTVGNLPSMPDAGIDPDAGVSLTIFTQTFVGSWTHVKLEAKRASDGSGIVTATGGVGAQVAPPIPPGSLAQGIPLVGLATTVTGPSGPFEIQFDNVTIDFPRD